MPPPLRRPLAAATVAFTAFLGPAPAACTQDDGPAAGAAAEIGSEQISSKQDLGSGATGPQPPNADPTRTPSGEKRGLAAMTRDLIAGAKAVDDDPLAFVPARATILFQARLADLYKIPGFANAVDFVADKAGSDTANTVDALHACGLDLAKLESVTLAMDADEDGALVLHGAGFGAPDKWRCLKKDLVGKGMSPDFEVVEEGGKTILRDDEDGGRFIDDDTFVFVDAKWEVEVDALLERADGKGSVLGGGLQPLMDRVDMKEPVWFAARLPKAARGALDTSPFKGTEEIWGALAVAEDPVLSLTVATRAPSADAAETMRAEVQSQWDSAKGMASSLGLPASLVAKVEFRATADVASFHISATEAEIVAVRDATKAFF